MVSVFLVSAVAIRVKSRWHRENAIESIASKNIRIINIEDLEKKLSQGEQWEFRKELDVSDYLGWILLIKRDIPIIYPKDAYKPKEKGIYTSLIELREKLTKTPYQILNIELKREVHESDAYENEEDYRFKESLYFTSLQKVRNYFSDLGYNLHDIKHRSEIDAP
ncbi:MAG: hypothetical protein SW833_20260 [Cyanobacteriota bacterium]|nr:hypothetical protein [Cyanobacteriota bacterium]